MLQPTTRHINPKKLKLSKWTAVEPRNKEKHFIVTNIIEPEQPDLPIEWIELEAVYSHRILTLPWRELANTQNWLQGWQ